MIRAYRFRLFPSKEQDVLMRKHLWISKNLWNGLLEYSKETYVATGRFPKKSELQVLSKGSGLYSQSQQAVSHRLFGSIKRVFTLRKKGVVCGFPRFKSFDRMRSLYYPQSGFRLGEKLKVSPFGEIGIVRHREIKGKIKTLALKREASGKWFAVFTAEQEVVPKQNFGVAVGLDLGLKNFAVLSNGIVISNPRHLRKHEEKLAFLQRRLSRKVKRSHGWYEAKHKVALLHEKVSNSRKDFLHKTSASLVSEYSQLVLEDLAPQRMAEEQLGKSIHDVGWGMFAGMVRYKAEGAGCEAVFVNPKDTTKECSRCGFLSKKDLWTRIHDCPSCGYRADRDLNAAEVILKRATLSGQRGCNADGLVAEAT